MTFKCNCGKTIEFDNQSSSYNIGQAQKATGWRCILTRCGGTIWLCNDCFVKVVSLVQQLVEITGTDDIYLPGILFQDNEEPYTNCQHLEG